MRGSKMELIYRVSKSLQRSIRAKKTAGIELSDAYNAVAGRRRVRTASRSHSGSLAATANLSRTAQRGNKLKFMAAVNLRVALTLMIGVLWAGAANAIGVGAADVRSSLGERLQILIPIFNVENPDSLLVSASTDMFENDPERRLVATLERSNSQLAVVVSTPWALMEPYVQFTLELQDGSIQQKKDIIVLLEYRPGLSRTDPLRVPNTTVAESDSSRALAEPDISAVPSARDYSYAAPGQPAAAAGDLVEGAIMGPYEWAEAGQIPAKFGAVLDGQSLWRVARRINEAMGVSVEQMMVALYEANPQAFYGTSTKTLKAGSYLNIPAPQVVARRTERQALNRLDELDNGASPQRIRESDQQVQATPAVNEVAAEQGSTFRVGSNAEIENQANASARAPRNAAKVDVNDKESVIDALSRTIGDLMRDNIDKEQRLQSLEARLQSVENTLDSVGLLAAEGKFLEASSSTSSADVPSEAALVDLETDAEAEVEAEPEAEVEPETKSEPAIVADVANQLAAQNKSSRSSWWWALLPLGLLGLWLGFRARRDIVAGNGTDLFAAEGDSYDEIEEPSVYIEGRKPQAPNFEEYQTDNDYSVLKSQRSQQPEESVEIEGVSYHEYDQEESLERFSQNIAKRDAAKLSAKSGSTADADAAHTLEYEAGDSTGYANGEAADKSSATDLVKQIDSLIEERRFTEARDLLDINRGKQLDEANYHFHRLRLLLEKSDEHGFYEYFNLVEAKFQDVDQELKMDLADLVARLNQQQ